MTASVLQEAFGDDAFASGTTVTTAAFGANATVGSTIEVWLTCNFNSTNLPTTVIDSAAQSYTNKGVTFDTSGQQSLALYVLQNNTSTAKLTVTATYATAQTGKGIWSKEIGGVTSVSYDNSNLTSITSPGTGANAITGGAISPSNTPTLCSAIIMECNVGNGTDIAAGTGYTLGSSGWAFGGSILAKSESKRLTSIVSTAATATAATNGASGSYLVGLAIYDEAGGGAPSKQYFGEEAETNFEDQIDDESLLMQLAVDSQPVARVDKQQWSDEYFTLVIEDYEDPMVSDAEWASPLQPNAPSLSTQYFGDDAEQLIEEELSGYSDGSFQQTDSAPNAIEDGWNYSFDDVDEDWLLLDNYDARFAPPPATAIFQYFGEDAEWLTEDEPSQPSVDSYQQIDSLFPTSGAAISDEWVAATLEEEAEDFFADHFTNYDADQTFYDEQYDWDVLIDDDWYQLEYAVVGTNATTSLPPEDHYWLFDDYVPDLFIDHFGNTDADQTQIQDEWDWNEAIDDDWLLLDSDDYDAVPSVVAQPYYGADAESLDEDTHDDYSIDELVGANAALPPANTPEDPWDQSLDDVEDQWFLDELVGASFIVPPSTPVEDPWSWDNDDTDEEWILLDNDDYDVVGPNAQPTPYPENAYDFAYDDVDDEWWIDEVANQNGQITTQDEWDFAHDDVEDELQVDEVQNLNVAQPPEDAYDFAFDDIEDESFWHDEQVGTNAIPKVSYYGEDAESLDEQFDDELALSLDTDSVGSNYQALGPEDPWSWDNDDTDEEWTLLDNDDYDAVPPNPSPFIDYGDELLHFFDELYLVDDDTDWFATPVYIVIPKRTRLKITQVTTVLKVRK